MSFLLPQLCPDTPHLLDHRTSCSFPLEKTNLKTKQNKKQDKNIKQVK